MTCVVGYGHDIIIRPLVIILMMQLKLFILVSLHIRETLTIFINFHGLTLIVSFCIWTYNCGL